MNAALAGTVGGAFLAGLVASLHCVGMCGPLACAACRRPGGCGSPSAPAAWYHGGRFLSYTVIGAFAGAFGHTLIALRDTWPWLPWAGGAVLLIIVAAIHSGRISVPGFAKGGTPPLLVGLITPTLPCAPLYLMFLVCAVSGSPVRGAALALAFSLGTAPLLLVAQFQWSRFQRWAGIRTAAWVQRGLFAMAFAVVFWRAYAAGLGAACCDLTSLP